eukprot:1159285-Pelagomonas_calceolata.AAC.6
MTAAGHGMKRMDAGCTQRVYEGGRQQGAAMREGHRLCSAHAKNAGEDLGRERPWVPQRRGGGNRWGRVAAGQGVFRTGGGASWMEDS